ncbi:MAG TPA: hypothetical protein VG943_04725 [Caulobacterales bacterium]|nr:hypothetical protein [Caulobacterales bacterium]
MLRALLLGGAAVCLASTAAFAEGSPARYVVIEQSASIAYPNTISAADRVDDSTVIFRVGANRWYRAELAAPCARDATRLTPIEVDTRGRPAFDVTGRVVIDGRRCALRSFDRIERPEALH